MLKLAVIAKSSHNSTGFKKGLVLEFSGLARKIQEHVKPMMGWIYAVETKYADSKTERLRALTLTLYLDERSERISKFTDQEKSKAREWLKQNNPFQPKKDASTKSKAYALLFYSEGNRIIKRELKATGSGQIA